MANLRQLGLGWLVSINNSGNNASPTWQPLGISNQKTLDHQLKNKLVDVTGKGDSGFTARISGIADIQVVVDFSLITTDPAYIQMKTNYKNQASTTIATRQAAECYIQLQRTDGNTYVYNCWISDLDESAPYDKELTGKVTFGLDGPPATWYN